MTKLPLVTPLSGIRGIGPGFLKRLEKLGITTIKELLWHFPARYEDFSKIYKISELEPGQHATIQGAIEDVGLRRTWKKHITIVEATIADESGSIKAIWFNQPYLLNSLKPGRVANFAGKISVSDDGEIYLSHPAYELLASNRRQETRHTARLVPIYPETKGLTSKGIRYLIQPILKNIEKIPEWLSEEILKKYGFPDINRALKDIHFPDEVEEAAKARRRFEFEDLFLLQLHMLKQKLRLAEEKARPLSVDIEWLKDKIENLPFELTVTQKKSFWEIIKDLEKQTPMNRLLQGDVGSGKTVVAVMAALVAAKNSLEAAFMAPTEVLARQHFETLKSLFRSVSRNDQPLVALITGSEAKILYDTDTEENIKKENLKEKIRNGEVKIVIGTHALIEDTVQFKHLGLVIVDEQHRFGVRQRQALARREGEFSILPHFLSMSATPIPRTLMMTVFGDLDISTITELPTGRKNIATKVVSPTERPQAYEFIKSEVKNGRQVFVVCPRIDPRSATQASSGHSDNLKISARQSALWDVKSVKEEFEKLSEKIFRDLRVAMLHGKMKPAEKEKIMNDFRRGETDILVSTSVVEVGVDVPNATIMMIEGADRFGLAQLYQLRGRVGRGEYQSYCLLFTDSVAQSTKDRLRAVIEAKNGFELAERDLKLRGPGEFLGEAQAGMPDIAMKALQDIELVTMSREAAKEAVEKDSSLGLQPELKNKLKEFEESWHFE